MLTYQGILLQPVEWHDGDTTQADTELDIGWGRTHTGPLRLTSSRGPINLPEVTGSERPAGELALRVVERWTQDHAADDLWAVSHEWMRDARGRTIAEVWARPKATRHGAPAATPPVELGAYLLDHHLAKFCEPDGKRVPFTGGELAVCIANATRLLAQPVVLASWDQRAGAQLQALDASLPADAKDLPRWIELARLLRRRGFVRHQ